MRNKRLYRPYTLHINQVAGRVLLTRRSQTLEGKRVSERLAVLRNTSLELVWPHLRNLLHHHRLYRVDESTSQRVSLPETVGARVALMFWGISPLRKPSRIELLCTGVRAMSDEEVYYWYSKISGNIEDGVEVTRSNALVALRMMLSGE